MAPGAFLLAANKLICETLKGVDVPRRDERLPVTGWRRPWSKVDRVCSGHSVETVASRYED